MEITSTGIEVTKLALDGLYERQKAIAANTANVETPDYQRKEVSFESQLSEIIKKEEIKNQIKEVNSQVIGNNKDLTVKEVLRTSPYIIKEQEAILSENNYGQFKPSVSMDMSQYDQIDGNNVILEKEMMDMAQTGMKYNVIATLQGKMFTGLQTIIRGQ